MCYQKVNEGFKKDREKKLTLLEDITRNGMCRVARVGNLLLLRWLFCQLLFELISYCPTEVNGQRRWSRC
jgi:hypothetical protein